MPSGKKPSVTYWPSRKAYGCWITGTQHILVRGQRDDPKGPNYLEALGKFRKLLALETDKGTDEYLVSSLLNQYRANLKATRKSGAPGVFEIMARGFGKEYGHLRVSQLKPHMLEQWLERQKQWNPTSKAHAGQLILAAVSWARKKGFIENDPLRGRVDLPQPLLRGREARMSEELMDLIISESNKNKMRSTEFAEFFWALRVTGARPIELRKAEAFNYDNGKLIFRWNATRGYTHKTAKKTQRDRVIFLTPELQAHVEKLIQENPTGPIFRTPRGEPWIQTSLSNKWTWVLKRPKVLAYLEKHGITRKEMRIYNTRHSWASSFLDKTGDIYGASLMLGTSVKMLATRYGHADLDKIHARFLAYHRSISGLEDRTGEAGTATGSA